MSEHAPKSAEQLAEAADLKVTTKHEKHSYSAEQKAEQVKQAEALLQQVEAGLNAAERPALPIDDKPADNQFSMIDNVAKALRRKQSLQHIQRRLPPTRRALSKVIHQPAVRAVSEVSSKTVSRPSGLLGGGIMAFVGSLSYLYLAKHIGFSYNYLLFLLFFVGGFVVGLVVEMLLRAWRPSSR